jgi:hypothetical protein
MFCRVYLFRIRTTPQLLIKHKTFSHQIGPEMVHPADLFCVNDWQTAASTLPFSDFFILFFYSCSCPHSPIQKQNLGVIYCFLIQVTGSPVDRALNNQSSTVNNIKCSLNVICICVGWKTIWNMTLSRRGAFNTLFLSYFFHIMLVSVKCYLVLKWTLPCTLLLCDLTHSMVSGCGLMNCIGAAAQLFTLYTVLTGPGRLQAEALERGFCIAWGHIQTFLLSFGVLVHRQVHMLLNHFL